jgi:hypothetical protein
MRLFRKASTSFLKKRSKKLLRFGLGCSGKAEPSSQRFFGSFFQKRTKEDFPAASTAV